MLQPNISYTPSFRPMPPILSPKVSYPQAQNDSPRPQSEVSASKCSSIGATVGAVVNGLWLVVGSSLPKAEQYLWNKRPLSQLLFVGIAAVQGAFGGALAGIAIARTINSDKKKSVS
jgi:hypothetical protein